MFRITRLARFPVRGSSPKQRSGSDPTSGRSSRSVRPVVEKLETRNLLSHATPAMAIPAHVHATSEVAKVPSYPYSGVGHIHFLPYSQVPADTGPQLVHGTIVSSLGNYKGLAVRKGAAYSKDVRGTLELFLGPVAGEIPAYANHSYNTVSYTGDDVYSLFPGKVLNVVDNWTPKSHDPHGNDVVIQTVEPDGLVFDIRYSHLLSNIKVKKGEYLSPKFMNPIGQGGHTGVPADQNTTYSMTIWTPEFGGQYLKFGYYAEVAPESIGIPPNFVDLDPNPNGSTDDPDNDADDPNGFSVPPPSP